MVKNFMSFYCNWKIRFLELIISPVFQVITGLLRRADEVRRCHFKNCVYFLECLVHPLWSLGLSCLQQIRHLLLWSRLAVQQSSWATVLQCCLLFFVLFLRNCSDSQAMALGSFQCQSRDCGEAKCSIFKDPWTSCACRFVWQGHWAKVHIFLVFVHAWNQIQLWSRSYCFGIALLFLQAVHTYLCRWLYWANFNLSRWITLNENERDFSL